MPSPDRDVADAPTFEDVAGQVLAALSGCVLTLALSHWLSRFMLVARPLALIGRHTLVIFILHVSLQKALLVVYLDASSGESLSRSGLGILGLVSAAVTIAITLLISMLADHLMSRHAGPREGATPSEAR